MECGQRHDTTDTTELNWTSARANLLRACHNIILRTCYGTSPICYGLATGKLV